MQSLVHNESHYHWIGVPRGCKLVGRRGWRKEIVQWVVVITERGYFK